MTAPVTDGHRTVAGYVNIFCLLAAITLVFVLPFKKQIWYDETVSILCSKGISHNSQGLFSSDSTINSSAIEALNTPGNVFAATVVDNGNSFLYNIGLHWFSGLSGNSIGMYMLFSKLCAIAALLAFYVLCNLFFRNSIFTSCAILLLATDGNFTGMSHEIRAYSLGIFFVTLAAVCLFRYLFTDDRPRWLFLTGLFSAAAILTHFLCVYMVLAFLGILLYRKRFALLQARNIVPILVPVCLLAIYFYYTMDGIRTMSLQNHEIQEKFAGNQFDISEVIFRSMKLMAYNFKVALPMFRSNRAVFVVSFLFVLLLYVAGIKAATDKKEKRNLHVLFVLGAASSVFLVLLSIKSQHYTSLYFRYYSFGVPFSTLFVAYVLCILYSTSKVNSVVKGTLSLLIVVPVVALFVINVKSERPPVMYNHAAVAAEIVKENVHEIEVQEWRDAFLLQSLLPRGYKIGYFRNAASPFFMLHKTGGAERIPVIREDH